MPADVSLKKTLAVSRQRMRKTKKASMVRSLLLPSQNLHLSHSISSLSVCVEVISTQLSDNRF